MKIRARIAELARNSGGNTILLRDCSMLIYPAGKDYRTSPSLCVKQFPTLPALAVFARNVGCSLAAVIPTPLFHLVGTLWREVLNVASKYEAAKRELGDEFDPLNFSVSINVTCNVSRNGRHKLTIRCCDGRLSFDGLCDEAYLAVLELAGYDKAQCYKAVDGILSSIRKGYYYYYFGRGLSAALDALCALISLKRRFREANKIVEAQIRQLSSFECIMANRWTFDLFKRYPELAKLSGRSFPLICFAHNSRLKKTVPHLLVAMPEDSKLTSSLLHFLTFKQLRAYNLTLHSGVPVYQVEFWDEIGWAKRTFVGIVLAVRRSRKWKPFDEHNIYNAIRELRDSYPSQLLDSAIELSSFILSKVVRGGGK